EHLHARWVKNGGPRVDGCIEPGTGDPDAGMDEVRDLADRDMNRGARCRTQSRSGGPKLPPEAEVCRAKVLDIHEQDPERDWLGATHSAAAWKNLPDRKVRRWCLDFV